MVSQEDYIHYWVNVYRDKESCGFLFSDIQSGYVDEYYCSENHEFEVYRISKSDELISRNMCTITDVLKKIKKLYPDYWRDNVQVKSKETKYLGNDSYGIHTIWVASDFKSTIAALIKSLTPNEFLFTSNNDTFLHFNLENVMKNKDMSEPSSFSIELFRYRSECNEGYSGCMAIVENVPYQIANRQTLKNPISDWIYEKLEDIPCVVKFDFPRNSLYHFGSTTLDSYVKPFYIELAQNKIKSALFSATEEFYYIKTDPFLDDDQRLARLYVYLGSLVDKELMAKWTQRAEQLFGLNWQDLSSVSRNSLSMGIGLFEQFSHFEDSLLDASAPAIQFSKCIETELEQKLLLPYREYFNSSEYKSQDMQADLKDKDIVRMADFLRKPESKALEMGTFAYFLSVVINSKSRAETSLVIRSFKEFVQELEGADFLINTSFTSTLNTIISKYRNGAAHTKALPMSDVNEFYHLLLGQNKDGLLHKLISALKKKLK